VITSPNGTLLPAAAGNILRATTGIAATAVRYGQISAYGKTAQINGVDPATIAYFYNCSAR
jgi:hypothetical protein